MFFEQLAREIVKRNAAARQSANDSMRRLVAALTTEDWDAINELGKATGNTEEASRNAREAGELGDSQGDSVAGSSTDATSGTDPS